MDGIALQDRIYKGYSRVADSVGLQYDLYRASFSSDITVPDRDMLDLDPIVPKNKIRKMPIAVAADKDFSVPNKFHSPTWYCYADGRKLQQFDFLVGAFGTFYIADKQPNLPMQAIKTNHVLSIGRGIYSTVGPIGQTINYYATRLPCFIQFKREQIKATIADTIGQATTQWDAFIPLPNNMIKQDDIVFDEEGNRYLVDAPDFTEIGYSVRLRLAQL
jgi:hypothetical protein